MGRAIRSGADQASALAVFRRHCGLDAEIVLNCEDTEQPSSPPLDHSFDSPFVVIGRDPASDLILEDPRVSRRHALVQAVSGRLFCLDLQSRTQLRWEHDDRKRTRGWLLPGQALAVGPFLIRGDSVNRSRPLPPEDWDPCLAPPPGAVLTADVPGVHLELPIQAGTSAGSWQIEGLLALVGRSDACQLVLSDEGVSRLHAYFVRTPAGVWVVDLRARQGVYVNGIRVRWAWLEHGDLVKFGPFAFKVRYDVLPTRIQRRDVPLSAGAVGDSSGERAPAGLPAPRSRAGNALMLRGRSRGHQHALPAPASGNRHTDLMIRPQVVDAAWQPAIEPPPQTTTLWQQHMQAMEAFHQDMILMVQMFAAMHREHLQSVRDELDQVRRLTRELEELQKGLADPQAAKPSQAAGPASAEKGAVPPRPEDRRDRSQPRATPAGGGAGPARPPQQGRVDSPSPPASPPPAPGNRPPQVSEPDHLSLHSALCQRIAEVQKERQGYWRKILGAISK